MHYTFKKMKKGSYFGHLDDHTDLVYKKIGTYTFEDIITGEEFNIKTTWPNCYDEHSMFCLAEVVITIKHTWRPEW
ncbi:hypothetical protein [Yersinia phage fHe-Yen9-03]|uniref:Uncharacterized protein n=1 Tax=Yersinia phage fHe-Yen9-03 TaxID=2052743 RepID=A0A2C9CZ55_9CAUD|nr:hypothetical protein [Yersinia phage fHe-Yen9-03]